MTTTTPQLSPPDTAPVPGSGLSARLAALDRLVELGTGRIDQSLIDDATALLERAGQRLRLSADHTVVALAGGTGSGKSSLFNAVCGLELSHVGVRRPMTSSAHACVWGLDGAGPLLDWLDIEKRYRYARASALDRDESSLQGLVLLDLPDHDSVRSAHIEETDKYVAVADLLVWVLDPQKYADFAVHRRYLEPLAGHVGITLIVLNQVDRLQPDEVDDCVSDLRRLLEAEGLQKPNILTTSAVSGAGIDGFREVLIDTVAGRKARGERLAADIDQLAGRFQAHCTVVDPPAGIEPARTTELIEALGRAAGVPAVAEAMESAYELRAHDYVGWPIGRLAGRFRADPLRRMRLTELRNQLRGTFTGPVGAQQSDVDQALHGVTDGVTPELPAAWQRSVRGVSRAHADELPEALGISLREVVPGFNQVPGWWWAVRAWQYLLATAAAACLIWLAAIIVFGVAGLAHAPFAVLGRESVAPYVGLAFLCTLGLGVLTASVARNMIALSSSRHSEKMEAHMHEGIRTAARELVLEPVQIELGVYADFCSEVRTVVG